MRKPLILAAALLAATLITIARPAHATGTTGTVTEYTTNAPGGAITTGPDGNLWTSIGGAAGANSVDRITPVGVDTFFGSAGGGLTSITSGPDGNLWAVEPTNGRLVRITTAGVQAGFTISGAGAGMTSVTAGPDGNLWFTETSNNTIGRANTSGARTGTFVVNGARYITTGSDGNLWVTQNGSISRVTPTGTVTSFSIGGTLQNIVAGPDGNLWGTEAVNRIFRITTAGVATFFAVPNGSTPEGITVGADGNLWFTEAGSNKIGRITTAGVLSEFPIPTANVQTHGITEGPDGNLWFSEQNGNRVGTLALSNGATQATSATVVGVLSIALATPSVAFGTLAANTTSTPLPIGALTYTNTLGTGTAWSATVAATSLVAGARSVPAANFTYVNSGLSGLAGSSGANAQPGAPSSSFTFAGCNGIGDVAPGVSFSCPITTMTGSATTQGDWSQTANTLRLAMPTGQGGGVYSGRLQYTVTG